MGDLVERRARPRRRRRRSGDCRGRGAGPADRPAPPRAGARSPQRRGAAASPKILATALRDVVGARRGRPAAPACRRRPAARNRRVHRAGGETAFDGLGRRATGWTNAIAARFVFALPRFDECAAERLTMPCCSPRRPRRRRLDAVCRSDHSASSRRSRSALSMRPLRRLPRSRRRSDDLRPSRLPDRAPRTHKRTPGAGRHRADLALRVATSREELLAGRLADERRRRVAFVSHCLLNENTATSVGHSRPVRCRRSSPGCWRRAWGSPDALPRAGCLGWRVDAAAASGVRHRDQHALRAARAAAAPVCRLHPPRLRAARELSSARSPTTNVPDTRSSGSLGSAPRPPAASATRSTCAARWM